MSSRASVKPGDVGYRRLVPEEVSRTSRESVEKVGACRGEKRSPHSVMP